MEQKVIRVGRNSLGVIIPALFTHALGVKAGDKVSVYSQLDEGTVRLKFKGNMQLSLINRKGQK